MRVLHININYIVSALHQTMIEHLNQLDIDSKVFVPTYDKKSSIVNCKEYVTVSECYKKCDRLLFYFKQNKIMKSIVQNYDVNQFDIIHAYTLFTDGNVAMNLFIKYGIPYVVAIRNTDVNLFFKKMAYLRRRGISILKSAKAVFFLSPVYKDIVVYKYVPAELREEILNKSYIIPNGIDDYWLDNVFERDADSIADRIENNKIINCIYVGSIDKNKNVELTLKALSLLNDKKWKCTLTAIGKIKNKKIFEDLCAYPFFKYVEPKKKNELINYYREADVFVMPSHTETFGLVYAEAMSQGLPVIYTKGQGFDGQFLEGEVGYAVSATKAESIVDGILACVSSYAEISRNCSNSVEKFSWNSIVQEYRDVYSSVLIEK